ncbi:hypothetical protein CASFOL_012096 [Castilleja foliolosa]|uniref:Uncharacterized protein n=1 Tax=Castilleja foliolosa TaxID=1961234 RepID=A0ABD3DT39_9LAMI
MQARHYIHLFFLPKSLINFAHYMATKIVEQCRVAPPSGAPAEQLLKLVHMDMPPLCVPNSVKTLFFYKLRCSESHFMDIIVPSLKNSLSLTLKHFPPLAGKILIDNNSGMPVSQYVDGQDSLSLTIAVSYADFLSLTGYHPRDAAQLHGFAPDLSDIFTPTTKLSVFAIQLTLFPNQGVCVGITGNHAIADGATLLLFLKKWACINKFNGDDSASGGKECLPVYDRDLVWDGDRRAMECWRVVSNWMSLSSSFPSIVSFQEHMVEATFALSVGEIQKLKNLVIIAAANSKKREGVIRVSSFVVACAHLWTCLAKSAATAGDQEVGDDEPDYLSFPINCRGRLNQPLPDNYFGNCTVLAITESTYGKLRGKEGFLVAAERISGSIDKTIGNGIDGSPKFYLDFLGRLGEMVGKRMLCVGGYPGLDFYGTEFGWGRPIKFEALQRTDFQVAFFSNSRENRGGLEICVSMSKVKMDAFAASFNLGIAQATEQKLGCKM